MQPTDRPTLARRDFCRIGMATLSGFYLLPMISPSNLHAKERVTPRAAAEYCVFLFLNGGAPQLDTWDLKEGRWTPPDFDVRTIKPGVLWPYGQFPKLAGQLDRVAIARSSATDPEVQVEVVADERDAEIEHRLKDNRYLLRVPVVEAGAKYWVVAQLVPGQGADTEKGKTAQGSVVLAKSLLE